MPLGRAGWHHAVRLKCRAWEAALPLLGTPARAITPPGKVGMDVASGHFLQLRASQRRSEPWTEAPGILGCQEAPAQGGDQADCRLISLVLAMHTAVPSPSRP